MGCIKKGERMSPKYITYTIKTDTQNYNSQTTNSTETLTHTQKQTKHKK